MNLVGSNFPGCLEKMFMLNPSFSIKASFKIGQGNKFPRFLMIKALMSKEKSDKVQFLELQEYSKLLESIPSDQLQVSYGGELPNVEVFW